MHEILAAADAGRAAADRRYLHARAETGFDLKDTFAYVWKQLTDMGLAPVKCGQCGILADIGKGEEGVLLRADMDALPVREEADISFASGNGCMHACGHDLHTAMLLEAARILKAREETLRGCIRLMFQPAEELLLGAADMLQNGLLDGLKVRAAYMIHVLTNIDLPAGTAIVSAPGVSAPAAGMFEVRIQGKGCHGAMPHAGVDPIVIAAHTVLNLQQIQTREVSMTEPCVLTVGMLQAGETANVIPDCAVLRGSLRAFDDETQQHLIRRVKEIAEGTAAIFLGNAQVRMLGVAPTLLNDGRLSGMAYAALKELLGQDRVLLADELGGDAKKSSGSEDFANVSHAVPSLMIALTAGNPSEGYAFPAHHPRAAFDEAVLPAGAAVYAFLAMKTLEM